MTAKVLPLAIIVLIIFMYVPSLHSRPAEIPPEVREAIKLTGAKIETTAEEVNKDLLSDEVAKLASEMSATGRELQDKPLTKKELLKDLSNLVREVEALKMMGKIAEELKVEMIPERKRILNELLEKLADNLKDFQGMEELSQKVLQARQTNLSMEALKELAAALEKMQFKASDMKALQQMAEQVAKGKRDIGQAGYQPTPALATARGVESQEEEGSGRMGGTAPGKEPARDAGETTAYDPRRRIPSDEGYNSDIEGQVSEEGRSAPTDIQGEPEKGESVVTYEEIYVKYREVADDAITRTAIPWIYREHVKNYFDAIKPKSDQ
jgi:hypothetical protein